MAKRAVPQAEEHFEPIFVARQPIFDRDQAIWGYDLLIHHSLDCEIAEAVDECLAASRMIADGFALAIQGIPDTTTVIVDMPLALILDQSVTALPKDRCLVGVVVEAPSKEALAALQTLAASGYRLAVEYWGQSGVDPLLDIAKVVRVPIANRSPKEVMALRRALKKRPGLAMAQDVSDWQTFAGTRSLGFQLFQGLFFRRPEIVAGRTLSTGAAARVRLLRELHNPDVEISDLSAVISSDLALSYRLLRFINSAGFGLKHTVQSISQAISLLGLSAFKQWAAVVAMSDVDTSGKGQELAYLALQRARFFETAAEGAAAPYSREGMFLLGLLSTLDAMFGRDMAEVLADMPLDEGIKAALLGQPSPGRHWLDLIQAVERGDWGTVETLCAELRLQPKTAAVLYLKATSWAQRHSQESKTPQESS